MFLTKDIKDLHSIESINSNVSIDGNITININGKSPMWTTLEDPEKLEEENSKVMVIPMNENEENAPVINDEQNDIIGEDEDDF